MLKWYIRDKATSNSSETANFRTKVSWKLPESQADKQLSDTDVNEDFIFNGKILHRILWKRVTYLWKN